MFSFITLVQGLGLAYAAGLNLYAAVAVTGFAVRFGWVHNVPTTIEPFGNGFVIALALALYVVEFVATLIPGVASAWETLHSLIRPPAAAVLAAATAWHADPVIVLVAALLGGGLAITTHTTKLGLRYAIDASPEPVTNGVANIAELGLVAAVAIAIWQHPFITLAVALARARLPDDDGASHLARAATGLLRPLDAGAGPDAGAARDGAPRRQHDEKDRA